MNISPVEIALIAAVAVLAYEVFRIRKVCRGALDTSLVKSEVEKSAAVVVEQRIKAWEIEEKQREDETEAKLWRLLEKRMEEQKIVPVRVQGRSKSFSRPLNQ